MTMHPVKSALIGYYLGDCLGAPYEFQSKPQITMTLGKSVFGHPPGQGTDDTELALAAGRAILTQPDFAVRREPWLREVLAWQDTRPRDIGSSTSASLNDWRGGIDPRDTTRGRQRGGNGALILATVPALAHYGDPDRAAHEAVNAASFTHPHPDALSAAAMYGRILGGGEPTEAEQEWLAGFGPSHGGFAPNTLWTAVAGLAKLDALSPLEALAWTVMQGGDTDTNAAMAGALIGIHTGTNWDSGARDQLDPNRLNEVNDLANALVAKVEAR